MSGTSDGRPVCTRCGAEYVGERCPDCEREETEIKGVPFLDAFDEIAFTEPDVQERWEALRRLCEAGYDATWVADAVTVEERPRPWTKMIRSMGRTVHTVSVRYPNGTPLAEGDGPQFADALVAAFPDGVPAP